MRIFLPILPCEDSPNVLQCHHASGPALVPAIHYREIVADKWRQSGIATSSSRVFLSAERQNAVEAKTRAGEGIRTYIPIHARRLSYNSVISFAESIPIRLRPKQRPNVLSSSVVFG